MRAKIYEDDIHSQSKNIVLLHISTITRGFVDISLILLFLISIIVAQINKLNKAIAAIRVEAVAADVSFSLVNIALANSPPVIINIEISQNGLLHIC